MKFTMFLFLLSFIITSCDAPVRTRVDTSDAYGSNSNASGNGDGTVTNPDTTPGNGVVTGGEGQGSGSDSDNFPGCEYLSPQYNGGSLGYFGLCQGIDQRQFKTILAETMSICYVPVHILNSGNSFKLGKAECVTAPQPDKVYYMTLNKEGVAPNYNNPRPEAVNGVMVIKPGSLNAYMGCMNAKEDFFVAAPNCCFNKVYNPTTNRYNCAQPNPACEQAANQEASYRCGMFVQNHSDNYRQVDFR